VRQGQFLELVVYICTYIIRANRYAVHEGDLRYTNKRLSELAIGPVSSLSMQTSYILRISFMFLTLFNKQILEI
jgi:hypothetical protein